MCPLRPLFAAAVLLLAACHGAGGGASCALLDGGLDGAQPGEPCGLPVGGAGYARDGYTYSECRRGLVCCASCGAPTCLPRCQTPCEGSDCECGCQRGPFP